jgi:hypothetical protein
MIMHIFKTLGYQGNTPCGSIACLNFDVDSEYVYRFYLSLPNGLVPKNKFVSLHKKLSKYVVVTVNPHSVYHGILAVGILWDLINNPGWTFK